MRNDLENRGSAVFKGVVATCKLRPQCCYSVVRRTIMGSSCAVVAEGSISKLGAVPLDASGYGMLY